MMRPHLEPEPTFVVRELRWEDLVEVADLEARLYPATAWSEAAWWAELAGRPRRYYLVAVCEGRVAGYAGLDLNGSSADVMTIAVDPRQQGRGIGAALLTGLHRQAARRSASSTMLEVRTDNVSARLLYARHGYQQIQVRPKYYPPEGVDALVLRRITPGADTPGADTSGTEVHGHDS